VWHDAENVNAHDRKGHADARARRRRLPLAFVQSRRARSGPYLCVVDPNKLAGWAIVLTLAFCGAMLLCVELGRRWARAQLERHGPESRAGVGVVDGAVYALLALLVGFSFSGAGARFDARRGLIAREANALSTAWQRIDFLPAEQQGSIRDALRGYLDAVIASYARATPADDVLREPPDVTRAHDQLWRQVVATCVQPTCDRARMLLVPSMNEVFDAVDDERFARRMHPPNIIFGMLVIAALASSLFIGYGLASASKRNWIYIIGFAASVSIASYVIIDLEFPRLGLIRVDRTDELLREQRAAMQPLDPQH
jgi:hypothetical protein